jgi:hypothetical protein
MRTMRVSSQQVGRRDNTADTVKMDLSICNVYLKVARTVYYLSSGVLRKCCNSDSIAVVKDQYDFTRLLFDYANYRILHANL